MEANDCPLRPQASAFPGRPARPDRNCRSSGRSPRCSQSSPSWFLPAGWGPDKARLRGSRPGDRFRSSNVLATMKYTRRDETRDRLLRPDRRRGPGHHLPSQRVTMAGRPPISRDLLAGVTGAGSVRRELPLGIRAFRTLREEGATTWTGTAGSGGSTRSAHATSCRVPGALARAFSPTRSRSGSREAKSCSRPATFKEMRQNRAVPCSMCSEGQSSGQSPGEEPC